MDYATQFLNKKVVVNIDRPIGSKHPKYNFLYPINYGFIYNTKAPDGEEIDAYVLGTFDPIEEFEGICIAVIHRINDEDDKLIVTKENTNYSDKQIKELTEFQEKFFKSIIIRK